MQTPEVDAVQRAVGDRYEVLSLAGVGGMGAVFRARHRTLGHIVAVKVLPPDVAASTMRHERFRREATLGASLDHPNIVRVYDFDTREGLSFLIMTFVRGDTVEEPLRTGGPISTVSPRSRSRRSAAGRPRSRPIGPRWCARCARRGRTCPLVSPPRSRTRSRSSRTIDRPRPRHGSPRSRAPRSGRGAHGRRPESWRWGAP